jgi:hypothetical protein
MAAMMRAARVIFSLQRSQMSACRGRSGSCAHVPGLADVDDVHTVGTGLPEVGYAQRPVRYLVRFGEVIGWDIYAACARPGCRKSQYAPRRLARETSSRDSLLGANVALSSEQLLNVGARGIENAGEVSRRHLDCAFSRGRDDGERCRGFGFKSGIYFSAPNELQRSSAILAHKFDFVESPARVVQLAAWSGCRVSGPTPAVGAKQGPEERIF